MPFCWIDMALTRWVPKNKRPKEPWTLSSQMFVDMGTALHASVQAFLGLQGTLWGSWECKLCGRVWWNCKSPGLCCGRPAAYIEYSLVHPDKRIGEFGHKDGILIMPQHRGCGTLEVKTTGESLAGKRKKEGPPDQHHRQASCYNQMARKGYMKAIRRAEPTKEYPKGEILEVRPAVLPAKMVNRIAYVYIRRNSPRPQYWIPIVKKAMKGVLQEIEADVPYFTKSIRAGKANRLPEFPCKEHSDTFDDYGNRCIWAPICLSPQAGKQLKVYARRYRQRRKGNK